MKYLWVFGAAIISLTAMAAQVTAQVNAPVTQPAQASEQPFAPTEPVCVGTDLIDQLPDPERQALAEEVAATPFAKGLFWRATKGDTVIALFGTYHFRHEQTDVHLERLKPFIESSDIVYLEISKDDQDNMQRMMASDPSMMFITQGPTLPDLLGDAYWDSYAEAMRARSIPGFMAAKFKPFWATMMLGIGPCEASFGALEETGIDELVGDYADQIGVGSRSLDDFRTLLTVMDDDPMEQQLEMIRLSLDWTGSVDDLSYTIRERYLAQDVALTLAFSRAITLKDGGPDAEADFDRFMKLLLEDRNAKWVDTLTADIPPGAHVFMAVGAGHLPGEIGVLRMLEQEGFTIERLPL